MAISFIGQPDLPLGLRNNNPGDFRTGIAWQGITGQENGFLTFQDITYGLRALAKDLINNINGSYNTIRSFITRYAPPSENDTAGYISSVAQQTGLDPDEALGTDQDTLHSIMRAIMNKELGGVYSAMITDSDINQGIAMAQAGSAATIQDALTIGIENPAIYIQSASPSQWAKVAGIGIGMLLIISYLSKK